MSVLFRPQDHTYWLGKKQIPGITRVLADCGYSPGSRFFTQNSRDLGQAVHTACRLADQECPDATTLDEVLEVLDLHPDLHGHLQGWLLFRKEKRFRSRVWEQQTFSPSIHVAGIYDCNGDTPQGLVVVDVKSWKNQGVKPKRSSELQLAGYARMIREQTGDIMKARWVVKLSGDGEYRCYECNGPRDEEMVVHAAELWWDRVRSGVLKLDGDPEESEE